MLVLTILGLIVAISGCTSETSNKTYSGNGLSFSYPGNWSQLNNTEFQNSIGSSGTLLVVFGDKGQDRFGIGTVNLGANQVLRTPSEWATSMNSSSGFEYISGKTITIDGVNGYQLSMKDTSNNYNYYYAYWVKNNTGYLSVLSSPNNVQAIFDGVTQSVKTT
jgi:hypothetical protein